MTRGYRGLREQLFWMKVYIGETILGCWAWLGAKNKNGYGVFWNGKKTVRAHRFSFELKYGRIPEKLHLDHLCGNRNCVNPYHLEAVNQRTNNLRGNSLIAMQARQTHCKKGHRLIGNNLVKSQLKFGRRKCKICYNEWQRERRLSLVSQK